MKERARMKEKEGANHGGGLRREIWIHPDGKRMRRTTSASTANDSRLDNSDLEDLAQLTSIEVCIFNYIALRNLIHKNIISKICIFSFI